MENLVAQFKGVPDNMLEEKSNAERLAESVKDLVLKVIKFKKSLAENAMKMMF